MYYCDIHSVLSSVGGGGLARGAVAGIAMPPCSIHIDVYQLQATLLQTIDHGGFTADQCLQTTHQMPPRLKYYLREPPPPPPTHTHVLPLLCTTSVTPPPPLGVSGICGERPIGTAHNSTPNTRASCQPPPPSACRPFPPAHSNKSHIVIDLLR